MQSSAATPQPTATPGRHWRRRGIILAVILGVAWWPSERLWYYAWINTVGGVPSRATDFTVLERVLPPVGATLSAIHCGLPHQSAVPDELLGTLFTTRTCSIGGYRFRSDAVQPAEQLRIDLDAALRVPALYQRFGGPYLCGGYHPDLCFTWQTPQGPHHVLLCMGCREVVIIGPGAELYCELRKPLDKALLALAKQLAPAK